MWCSGSVKQQWNRSSQLCRRAEGPWNASKYEGNELSPAIQTHEVAIEIGGIPVLLRTEDASFRDLLENRYAGFVSRTARPKFEFDVDVGPHGASTDEDLQVKIQAGKWLLRRGDFNSEWDPRAGKGWIRQSANPYSIDSVLRIVHSLILAREGGFLVHSASAIRTGRAFLFSGLSGAGKTTISRLAPSDVTLLTDEISYVRRDGEGYRACGTPFAGELARLGENCSAPVATLFFLEQGPKNQIRPISSADAVRRLLRNILFFADDADLVKLVFRSALDFVTLVPARRLTFLPDERVWELVD